MSLTLLYYHFNESIFLRQEIYEKIKENDLKKFTSDIISVLAMTMSEERECLKYRLLGHRGDIGDWGHEYVRYVKSHSIVFMVTFSVSSSVYFHYEIFFFFIPSEIYVKQGIFHHCIFCSLVSDCI